MASLQEELGQHILSNGLKVPGFVQQENLDRVIQNLELYPDDVWICSYPKCGTIWTAQIARLIKNRGVQDDTVLTNAVPWPERDEQIRELSRPRIFRSHFPYHLFPCGPPHTTPCKYIFITRNPKDVAVSFYYFMRQGWKKDLKWDGFFEMFMKGDVIFGDYFAYLLTWLPHKDDPNVLFLQYEEMKKDLSRSVAKIAAFMEVDLTSEVIDKIAGLTTFNTMKMDDTANLSWYERLQDENGKGTFLRKGVVGDWKEIFSEMQSSQIDRKCDEMLKDSGFHFQF